MNMDNRLLYDEKTGEKAKLPVMPVIVAMEGLVSEACSIKGAAAIIIGNHYYDSPDENLDWNLRVEIARKECMKALGRGIEAVVYDKRHGIIQDNFAAQEDDEDYEIEDEDLEEIRVENDKVFLLSLARIGAIKLLEREDSFFFRPDPDESWDEDNRKEYSGGSYIDIYQAYDISKLIIVSENSY
jgi:hypothetical protein